VGARIIDLSRLVELFSCGPARIFGLPGGTLAPGSPADVTVLDLQARRAVEPKRFLSKGRSTPFAGWSLKGWPVLTIVGGRVSWSDLKA
jgi:dihydroorotase